MSFLMKIQAAAEKKIPPATDKIYEKKFKLKGHPIPVSVFQASGADTGKILIWLFPKWTKADHLAAAFKHKRDYDRLRGKWNNIADKAHQDTFGKERSVWDYKVSHVGDDKYPEDAKEKLRRLSNKNSKAAMLSGAHEEAAKLVGRIKVKQEPVAAQTKITDFKSLKKGDKVLIKKNSIFEMMGMDKVSGEIAVLRPDGCSIKCKETGAYETADFDDGEWFKL